MAFANSGAAAAVVAGGIVRTAHADSAIRAGTAASE